MTDSKRRSVLRALGALALLPMGTTQVIASPRKPVAFPQYPIRLRRKLVRSLRGGAAIEVVRDWSCRFERLGAGARLSGQQVGVSVQVPPPLKAMAAIEEQRDASGFLPLELDRTGLIVDWSQGQGVGARQAVRQAIEMFDDAFANASERQTAADFVTNIGKTAAEMVSQIPQDLIYPVPGTRIDTRPVELSEGLSGSYEVAVTVEVDPLSGLLRTFERTVTTTVGDTSRQSGEVWEIA